MTPETKSQTPEVDELENKLMMEFLSGKKLLQADVSNAIFKKGRQLEISRDRWIKIAKTLSIHAKRETATHMPECICYLCQAINKLSTLEAEQPKKKGEA
jgi:hypothetical protein